MPEFSVAGRFPRLGVYNDGKWKSRYNNTNIDYVVNFSNFINNFRGRELAPMSTPDAQTETTRQASR